MVFNDQTVKFITTPDGIRGAIYIGNELGGHMCPPTLVPCHIWQGTKPTYVHRYECATI